MKKNKIKEICIVYKDGLNIEIKKTIEEISKIFSECNINAVSYSDIKKSYISNSDLVITYGGDGTFLKAGNLTSSQLIIGLNQNPSKSEGALTEIDISQIEKLKKIKEGKYSVKLSPKIQVKLNGKKLQEEAINEVYVGTKTQYHSSRYIINYKGSEEEQRSAGVIISTNIGSHAWFLSAGGKPFHSDKNIAFVIREPYFGNRIYKPTILQGKLTKDDSLKFISKRNFDGAVIIGDSLYDFLDGDIVEISISNNSLRQVKL